jgi:hypothetical protein
MKPALALLMAFALLSVCLWFDSGPAQATIIAEPLRPAVDPLPRVQDTPLKPLAAAPPATVDITTRAIATAKEHSDVQQLESELAQKTTPEDQSILEDAIRKCLIKAAGELAALLAQGQTPDVTNTGNFFSCLKEELLGPQNATTSTDNEAAVQTLAIDLMGQVDIHANEVAEAGATPGELAAWLTDTANGLPGGQPATSPSPTPSVPATSQGSSFPWVWIVLGVVVIGGGVALARK